MTPVLSPSMSSILGLHRVVPRLIAEDAFQNSEAALRGIAEYERFFLLAATNGKEPLVPSTWVDLVWQRHMLDSKAYTEDCDRWAGVYLHRDEGVPPGGFERSLALLGTPDPAVWNRPGPAFVQSDLNISCDSEGPTSDLESEELSGVLARVCQSLQTKPNAPPWVVDARDLLKTEPELAVREYRRFLMLMIRESGSLTPCKLVDEFWHQHILDSRAYLAFCSRVAGR